LQGFSQLFFASSAADFKDQQIEYHQVGCCQRKGHEAHGIAAGGEPDQYEYRGSEEYAKA
jgi:hypothetical protein